MLINILMATFILGLIAVSASQLLLRKVTGDKNLEQMGELEDLRRHIRIKSSYIYTSRMWPSGLCVDGYIEVRSCNNQTLINNFPTQTVIGDWQIRAKCEAINPTKLIIEYSNVHDQTNTWTNLFPSVPLMYGSNASAAVDHLHNIYYRFDQSIGPYGEQGLAFQPLTIPLTEDNHQFSIKSTVGTWGLGGGSAFSANGAPWGCDNFFDNSFATDPRYFRSNIGITQPWKCGSLIGMWTDGTPTPGSGLLTPFFVGGATQVVFAKPPLARELVLAFHDGYRWTDNTGSQVIELQFDTCVN